MNHDRAVDFPIVPLVFETETFGQVVIDLDGAQLPFPPNDVFDDEIDFWTVESGLAFLF